MHSNEIAVYTAEPDVLRFKATLQAMVRGAWNSRYVAYRLVRKDIRAGYSKSAMGMFWDLADPLVLGLIFYKLMEKKVIEVGHMDNPYPIFVIYGLMLYFTFMQSLLSSIELIRSSKGLLNQLKVAPEALILSVFFRVLFDSSFRILVMLTFSLLLWRSAESQQLCAFDPVGFLKFLALYPFFILWSMSLGLLLAPFNVVFTDVGRLAKIVITPLRFITPVLWPIHIAAINDCNPVTAMLNLMRGLATENLAMDWQWAAFWGGIGVALFLVGWFVFRVSVPVLAEKA